MIYLHSKNATNVPGTIFAYFNFLLISVDFCDFTSLSVVFFTK